MDTIAIIGGGASGLITAISAAINLKKNNISNTNIIVLERMDRVGKKILATGNGRCNLSNLNTDIKYYHGRDINFAKEILKQFTPQDTIHFFEQIGVICKAEADGRIYPYSNQASSVLDVLRMKLQQCGIKEICDFEVKTIKKQNKSFIITEKSGKQQMALKLIVATGGKASPNLGSNGSGYDLLKSLGHSSTDIFPALVQIKSSNQFVKALNGIKVNGTASIIRNGKTLRKETGEILFTEYGLSGILILQLSRVVGEYKNLDIAIDIMPDFTEESLVSLIKERIQNQGWKTLEDFLTGMFNKRVGQMIIKTAAVIPLSRLSNSLSTEEVTAIVKVIKRWIFPVTGTMSWNNAQITAGGINTFEFDNHTLESKLIKNLYVAGEVLDIDGDCGGFNLQWAWATGFIAGKNCAFKSETNVLY